MNDVLAELWFEVHIIEGKLCAVNPSTAMWAPMTARAVAEFGLLFKVQPFHYGEPSSNSNQ